MKKPTRTISGVKILTILTAPYNCRGECIFCPTEVRMPKSYLSKEPAAARALGLNFDPYLQTLKRLEVLENNNHPSNKIEVIIAGGTWDDYPEQYRINFIAQTLNALNGEVSSIQDYSYESIEKLIEENSLSKKYRMVGLSIETRPDAITVESCEKMRQLGITKVQIGVQSLDNEVLEKNKRGHKAEDSIKAVKLLRSYGFKIQVHWMPNLLGSTTKKDKEDISKLYKVIMPDEIKIYPCSLIDSTELYKKHYLRGLYLPYTEEELLDVISYAKSRTPPYTRISRVIRDIPSDYIESGNKKTNLREVVQKYMESKDLTCSCIRCRENRTGDYRLLKYKLLFYNNYTNSSIFRESIIGEYMLDSSHSEQIEKSITNFLANTDIDINDLNFFISAETENDLIAGFCRLLVERKISLSTIREVHVYGKSLSIGSKSNESNQHKGIGKNLIRVGEVISKCLKINSIRVIAAPGTRQYYRNLGYNDIDRLGYLIKSL